MIQNLNKLSFQPFGTVSPELPDPADWAQPWQIRELYAHSAPLWQAAADLWLSCDMGMAVLSVSTDGCNFYDFYLDKPVKISKCLRPSGVRRHSLHIPPAPCYQGGPRPEKLPAH